MNQAYYARSGHRGWCGRRAGCLDVRTVGLSEAKGKKKQLDEVLTLDNKWLAAMREAEDKTELDSELVKHLIKAVKIYEEKRVEVVLNFGEQKQVMERIIEEMIGGDADE